MLRALLSDSCDVQGGSRCTLKSPFFPRKKLQGRLDVLSQRFLFTIISIVLSLSAFLSSAIVCVLSDFPALLAFQTLLLDLSASSPLIQFLTFPFVCLRSSVPLESSIPTCDDILIAHAHPIQDLIDVNEISTHVVFHMQQCIFSFSGILHVQILCSYCMFSLVSSDGIFEVSWWRMQSQVQVSVLAADSSCAETAFEERKEIYWHSLFSSAYSRLIKLALRPTMPSALLQVHQLLSRDLSRRMAIVSIPTRPSDSTKSCVYKRFGLFHEVTNFRVHPQLMSPFRLVLIRIRETGLGRWRSQEKG